MNLALRPPSKNVLSANFVQHGRVESVGSAFCKSFIREMLYFDQIMKDFTCKKLPAIQFEVCVCVCVCV